MKINKIYSFTSVGNITPLMSDTVSFDAIRNLELFYIRRIIWGYSIFNITTQTVVTYDNNTAVQVNMFIGTNAVTNPGNSFQNLVVPAGWVSTSGTAFYLTRPGQYDYNNFICQGFLQSQIGFSSFDAVNTYRALLTTTIEIDY